MIYFVVKLILLLCGFLIAMYKYIFVGMLPVWTSLSLGRHWITTILYVFGIQFLSPTVYRSAVSIFAVSMSGQM